MLHGETLHSCLPWDIPWWQPDHAIFFGVLFAALGIIGLGVTYVVLRTVAESKNCCHGNGHH